MTEPNRSGRRVLAGAALLLTVEAAGYLAVLLWPSSPTISPSGDAGVGIGVALFVSVYALAHLLLAFGLLRRWTHVRGGIVATQLIQLGIAWNLRDLDEAWVPAVTGLLAVSVLVLVLLPSVTRALHGDDV